MADVEHPLRLFGDCENNRCTQAYHTPDLCDCPCHKHMQHEPRPKVDWSFIDRCFVERLK